MKRILNLPWLITLSTIILFLCSSLRHALFKSNALDLGWFDQAVYLISQGKEPIVSFSGFHILGDHAAWLFYPIASLYRLYPDVHWLFLLQALGLVWGGVMVWVLSRQAGLRDRAALALVGVYLLYPLVFNINLFDFHLDVFVIPGILWAVWAARARQLILFCIALIFILGCKAIFALTVCGLGIWLWLSEQRRLYGGVAIVTGILWFLIATQFILPHFTGMDAAAEMSDGRYSYLGESVGEIARNVFLKPQRLIPQIFTVANLEYLLLLFAPVFWLLVPQDLSPLIGALPALMLNVMAAYQPQKDLVHQYSAPILPFIMLCAIAVLVNNRAYLKALRWILLWSAVGFIVFAKYTHFTGLYLETWDTWRATNEAIRLVESDAGVLTNNQIAPHLTHREVIELPDELPSRARLATLTYILLDTRHPGWGSSVELIRQWRLTLARSPEFELIYQRDGVILYTREPV